MKLNLGAGEWKPVGYLSIDLEGKVDRRLDLRRIPWPFEDESASDILASHVLEHFTRIEGCRFLAECHRILARGGVLHLAVPDMDKFIDCRLARDFTPLDGYHWTDLNYLLGGDDTETTLAQRHQYMYCYASLAHALEGTGFQLLSRRVEDGLHNPAYAAISLYVDAYK